MSEAQPARDPRHKPETWGSAREYLSLVGWLLPDVVRHARARVVGVMLLSIASVAARGATAGSVLLYVKAQVDGKPIAVRGLELPSDASIEAFALWGGLAVFFAALDVATRAWSDRSVFRIAEAYAGEAMQDLLRHQAAGGVFEPIDELMARRANPIVPILQIDTQRLVRTVVQLLSLPMPVITFIVVIAVLASINAALTAVLLPLVVAYSLGVAAINRRVLRDTQRRRLAIPEVRRDVQGLAMTLAQTRYPRNAQPKWLTTFPRKAWMERSLRAYRGTWLARRRVQYLRDGFNGTALALIVMVFGALLASEDTPWATLLTYLVALGYGIPAMDKASSLVTMANRQIPHVRRYVWFMQHNPESIARLRAQAETAPPTPGPHVVSPSGDVLPESAERLELRPGHPTCCLYPERFGNPAVPEICLALAGGDPAAGFAMEAQTFAFARIARLPERGLRQHLPDGVRSKGTQEQVRDALDRLGLTREFDKEIGDVDRILSDEQESRLSPGLRYALRLLPGMLARPRFVMLAATPLSKLDLEMQRRILTVFREQIVLLVPDDPSQPLPEAAEGVLVIEDGRVTGAGDRAWHEGLCQAGVLETPSWIAEEREARARLGADSREEFDDDDEDD